MTSVSNKKIISLLMMTIIIAASITFGFYLYYSGIAEEDVRKSVIEQQQKRQTEYTNSLSKYVGSDLDLIISRLELLASKPQLQKGEFTGEETLRLLREADADINERTLNDGIILLNKDNIVSISTNYPQLVGVDASFRDYIISAKQNLKPTISEGLLGRNGKYGIGIAVPVMNDENGEYMGMLVGALVSQEFFLRYGNILDIDSQFITALDKNGAYLSLPSGSEDLIGKNFFSEEIQKRISGNQELNRMYNEAVNEGKLSSATFDTESGERFAVAAPVFYQGQQVMTVVTSTPTSSIYSEVENILAAQRIQTLIFSVAFAAVVGAVVTFLIRWNSSLEKNVRDKTREIKEANSQLKIANQSLAEAYEQLKVNEALQREFINIAAHELRTPIQPLLGAAELMETQFQDGEKILVNRAEVDMILRNAKRLERLSSDILELSRIDSGAIKLNKEKFSLAYIIANAVKDAKSQSNFDSEKLTITYSPDDIFVYADKEKITEVITNLLTNAIKFTTKGTISIATRDKENRFAEITVGDTGTGIDPEILPQLFSKFVTKSEKGTGIGLYISKKIVEAHGGKISGENNLDEPGAIFRFTLPLAEDLAGRRDDAHPSSQTQ